MKKLNLVARKRGAPLGYHLGVFVLDNAPVSEDIQLERLSASSKKRVLAALAEGFLIYTKEGKAVHV